MLQINDIVKVTMRIDLVGVPEDAVKINYEDYKREYNINYYLDDMNIAGISFDMEAGDLIDFDEGIDVFIKEDILSSFEEIADYEIFDVKKDDFEYQTAKVRIKAIK